MMDPMAGSSRAVGAGWFFAGGLLIALLGGGSCKLGEEACLSVRIGRPSPVDAYGDSAILPVYIDWNGPCSADGFTLRWWNETSGASGTGQVVDVTGCIPDLGCGSCDLQGLPIPDPPLEMGENVISFEVADPHGHVARDSIVVIRHDPICPCFTAGDVAARIAEIPTMYVREIAFSPDSDSSCQGASLTDALPSGVWGYEAWTKDFGAYCMTSDGTWWTGGDFCADADGRIQVSHDSALTCLAILRSFATP